jgi:Ca2+-binding EF-hand superfamily protein
MSSEIHIGEIDFSAKQQHEYDAKNSEIAENDESSLFKNLFNLYDAENKGYITIENFIAITKENMVNEEEVDNPKQKQHKLILSLCFFFCKLETELVC